MSYQLTVRTQQTRQSFMNVSLAINETKVLLNQFEGDQIYLYSVTATNEIGMTDPSEEKSLSKQ